MQLRRHGAGLYSWRQEPHYLPTGDGLAKLYDTWTIRVYRVADGWRLEMQPAPRRRWVRGLFTSLHKARAFARREWAKEPNGPTGILGRLVADDPTGRALFAAVLAGDRLALLLLLDRLEER